MQAMVPVESVTGTPLNGLLSLATTPAGALNADLFSGDLSAWGSVLIQILGTFVGTVTFQASNDGANWVSTSAINVSQAGYVTTATGVGCFVIPINSAYVRARLTAYTSGTVTAVAFLSPEGQDISPATISANATLVAATVLAGDFGMGVRSTSTNASTSAKVVSAASNNLTSVKATAGRVYGYTFSNTTASFKYVKLYNKASAPVVASDVPVDVIAIPPNDNVAYMNPFGVSFGTGIAYAITGGAADTDATNTAANDVIGKLIYA